MRVIWVGVLAAAVAVALFSWSRLDDSDGREFGQPTRIPEGREETAKPHGQPRSTASEALTTRAMPALPVGDEPELQAYYAANRRDPDGMRALRYQIKGYLVDREILDQLRECASEALALDYYRLVFEVRPAPPASVSIRELRLDDFAGGVDRDVLGCAEEVLKSVEGVNVELPAEAPANYVGILDIWFRGYR
jgi:hypothetical protein